MALPLVELSTPLTAGPSVAEEVSRLSREIKRLEAQRAEIEAAAGLVEPADMGLTWANVFNGYAAVMVAAFLVTLLLTPVMRRLAIANGIVDRPSDPRKIHKMPIAYLGGVSVFLGILGGILVSYLGVRFEGLVRFHEGALLTPNGAPVLVPPWIVLGITTIMLIGLIDDVVGISPRGQGGGQLFAAAALAYGEIGVNLAEGLLRPTLGALLNNHDLTWALALPVEVPLLGSSVEFDLVYWTGTAVIAVFVLGGCNASNLVDGLDGLCSGVTAVAMLGLLAVAVMITSDPSAAGRLDSARIVLCLAVLGACLGFLPHNFNPANIFLGDCGSLMLGFVSVVVILTLGDTGRTDLVVAGLFIYGIPILDTALAIIRRKMARKRLSDADSDHLHHMMKRALGVKGTALALYGIGGVFAVVGIAMAATNARIIYSFAIVIVAFIGVYAVKVARRAQLEEQVLEAESRETRPPPAAAAKSEPGEPAGAAV